MAGGVQLPPGAGSHGARFGGTVYTGDQAAGADGTPTPQSTAPRPLILVAKGNGKVVFTAPVDTAWLVRRIVVQSSVDGAALVYIAAGSAAAQLTSDAVVSGTVTGAFDENDANQPYLVPEAQSMVIVWVNGGACTARIEYQEI